MSQPGADEMADAGEAEMGEPKQGSAVEGITSSAWRALAEISGRTAEELYDPLCFIENLDTDTQVPFFLQPQKCLACGFTAMCGPLKHISDSSRQTI